jgi:hypothetical protein
VIASLALVGMATGQDKDAVKEEMKKLEGTWTLAWFEQGGVKTAAKEFKQPIEVCSCQFSEIGLPASRAFFWQNSGKLAQLRADRFDRLSAWMPSTNSRKTCARDGLTPIA